MDQLVPLADPRSLLPPLLACLPTSLVSPHPPPALLPLLSPILRQRVRLLSTVDTPVPESWLPLLCWDPVKAKKLPVIVEENAFELHPVSGEVELNDVDKVEYRRMDEETLQCRMKSSEMKLNMLYLWCNDDQEGGGSRWGLSELQPFEESEAEVTKQWWTSIGEAEVQAKQAAVSGTVRQVTPYDHGNQSLDDIPSEKLNGDDDENNSYWAQYDETPAKALSEKNPAPTAVSATASKSNELSSSEADYYEHYSHVQPEMDGDVQEKERADMGPSTIQGNFKIAPPVLQHETMLMPAVRSERHGPFNAATGSSISQPDPGLASIGPAAVTRLENSADSQPNSDIAIRQHVSTSMKSLFRLARSMGIERLDFDDLVRTELDTLSMWTEDY
ncbi:hypothetical protein MMC09_004480 [Bachmanniomyces sp. S44760]|nr:hypothetical protein [Bachmanniomyces sp. S44760]